MANRAKESRLLIVADDFGQHPGVNRGVYKAAETGAITGADLIVVDAMSTRKRVEAAVRTLRRHFPKVSLGLHVSIFPDVLEKESSPMVYELRQQRDSLLERLLPNTRRQLRMFQDITGEDPATISTHDHAHMGLDEAVHPEFIEAIAEGVDPSTVIIRGRDTKIIRHARATTLLRGEPPKSPAQFRTELEALDPADTRAVELLVHPGDMPRRGESPFESDMTLEVRVRDLEGLQIIVASGAIQEAGYQIVSPDEYLGRPPRRRR